MKVSTKLFNSQSVQKLNNLTEEIQSSQQQIFTGKRITKPSDDPVSASMSLIVKDQLAKIDQYSRNIDLSEVKLKLADSALDQLTNLTTRVYELAVAARTKQTVTPAIQSQSKLKGYVSLYWTWQTQRTLVEGHYSRDIK